MSSEARPRSRSNIIPAACERETPRDSHDPPWPSMRSTGERYIAGVIDRRGLTQFFEIDSLLRSFPFRPLRSPKRRRRRRRGGRHSFVVRAARVPPAKDPRAKPVRVHTHVSFPSPPPSASFLFSSFPFLSLSLFFFLSLSLPPLSLFPSNFLAKSRSLATHARASPIRVREITADPLQTGFLTLARPRRAGPAIWSGARELRRNYAKPREKGIPRDFVKRVEHKRMLLRHKYRAAFDCPINANRDTIFERILSRKLRERDVRSIELFFLIFIFVSCFHSFSHSTNVTNFSHGG